MSSRTDYLILGIMFIVGFLILGIRYYLKYSKKKKEEEHLDLVRR
jgi:hypothetical protein